jgi:hypothetical protein
MSDNFASAIWGLIILAFIILFAGEPDIHDAILEYIRSR